MPKPLNFIDSTEADWQKAADAQGISVSDLKEQIRLADEIIEEIFREEDIKAQNQLADEALDEILREDRRGKAL